MKKFRLFALMLLFLPMAFFSVSCKDKNSDHNQSQQEEPIPPDPPTPPVSDKTYSVSFDYNLPENYAGLLTNYSVQDKKVGTSTELATISDTQLNKYFLGWYLNDDLISNAVSGSADQEIKLKGKWDESSLNKYYYSTGLTFETSTTLSFTATVKSYTGTRKTVYVPKYYKLDGSDYKITGFANESFLNSNVENFVLNCSDISVGNSAFYNSKLKSIDFSTIKSIGSYAFFGSNIESAVLSEDISSVGQYAFSSCTKLTKFDISQVTINDINVIEDEMFKGCSNLTEIKLNNKITKIGKNAFEGCTKLSNLSFICESITEIDDYAFKGCTKLVNIEIPQTINKIGNSIFENCSGLKSLTASKLYKQTIDSSERFLTHIGNINATLNSITLKGSVIESIPEYYFAGLTGLTGFSMCNSIVNVGKYAFSDCANLASITFSEGLDADNFTIISINDTKFLKELTTPLIISKVLIYVPENVNSEVVIDTGVEKIQASAFLGNSKVTKVTIPSSVSDIGIGAFKNCENLVQVVFEENSNLTSIKKETFYNCSSLESINLLNLKAVESFADSSFVGINVSEFNVPKSVVSMGNNSVFSNANITSFVVENGNSKFASSSGVLYYFDDEDVVLFAYPKMKNDVSFTIPQQIMEKDVVKVESGAFAYSEYLECVYISHTSLTWGSKVSPTGRTTYNTFVNCKNDIILLCESENIFSPMIDVDAYYKISSDYVNASFDELNNIVLELYDLVSENYYFFVELDLTDDQQQPYTAVYAFQVNTSLEVMQETIIDVTDYCI